MGKTYINIPHNVDETIPRSCRASFQQSCQRLDHVNHKISWQLLLTTKVVYNADYAKQLHSQVTLTWVKCSFKGAVSRNSVIFLRFFCASKKWWLLAQVSWTSDQNSSVSRANSFTAQAESRKCRFPSESVVIRGLPLWPPLFFPTQNGCQKSPIIVTLPL